MTRMRQSRGSRIRAVGLSAALLAVATGCRTVGSDPRPPPTPPVGRVVYSDPGQGYAIMDFDIWPSSGQVLRLVDADGVTATIRVTGRRIGSCHAVEILSGRPKRDDYVAATREE